MVISRGTLCPLVRLTLFWLLIDLLFLVLTFFLPNPMLQALSLLYPRSSVSGAKKIAVVIGSMRGGGAERLVSDVVSEFSKSGINVCIYTLEPSSSFYATGDVRIISYPQLYRISTILVYLRILVSIIVSDASAIWLHLWPISMIAIPLRPLVRDSCIICITEHNNLLETVLSKNSSLFLLKKFFLYLSYCSSHHIVSVSHGLKMQIQKIFPFYPSSKISVISNPVLGRLSSCESSSTIKELELHPWLSAPMRLIAVGSLKYQKGYHYLLHALSCLCNDLHLGILGSGPLLNSLKALSESLELSDRVYFINPTSNVIPWLLRADLFVSASLWEGYGTAIAEAASLGLPIVCTDCDYGPSEILSEYNKSILVPPRDPASMAAAINKALYGNPPLHTKSASNSNLLSVAEASLGYANLLRLYY